MSGSPTLSSSSSSSTLPPPVLSDEDSGVDVKQRRQEDEEEDCRRRKNRRNKRKSSEPKRRKDVLLMKRFRWEDTDEEDCRPFEEEEDEDEVFQARPGSGDSGLQEDATTEDIAERRFVKEEPRQSVIIRKSEIPQDHHHPQYNEPASVPQAETTATSSAPRPRNYKSMSRQRRIEANARERTRVHTISAAFESLRRAVPAYAHNQKLSKLAILRIASAYIVALACLNGKEEDSASSASSMEDCVERCTRTIQAEGRSRRRTSKD